MNEITMINRLKAKEIKFTEGLTESQIHIIEETYNITFPESLRKFYSIGVPFSEDEDYFPRWTDFSDENIAKIKERIEAPIKRLSFNIKRNFWLANWGERPESEEERIDKFMKTAMKAPKLIPVYLHRYIPQLEDANDPPVISTVGQDTVYYGSNLEEYLQNEFLNSECFSVNDTCTHIPFWSDIINHLKKKCAETEKLRQEMGL